MAKIHYTKTYFQNPGRISKDNYYAIKKELLINPSFEFAKGESFTEHFKGQFTIMGIGAVLSMVMLALDIKDGNPLMVVLMISVLAVIINLFYLFLEAPSFAKYVMKRDEYFLKMKNAIVNSTNYDDFISLFY